MILLYVSIALILLFSVKLCMIGHTAVKNYKNDNIAPWLLSTLKVLAHIIIYAGVGFGTFCMIIGAILMCVTPKK